MCNMNNLNDNNKVVLFPGLVSRLVEKGMSALKEKRHREALALFQQALTIEPYHAQARYGVVLSKIELGYLERAAEESKKMLHEDIGDYFDVLSVHISLLVQLARYEEVVTMLEAVLAEGKMPPSKAESFYQLLSFSRQMVETYEIDTDLTELMEEKEPEEPEEGIIQQLHSSETRAQWIAIQHLWENDHPKVIEEFIKYIAVEEHDLILKSMVLQALKEMNVQEKVLIKKLGMTSEIIPAELPEAFEQPFAKEVIQLVSDRLDQENPTLKEGTIQLWRHFMFAMYPFVPTPADVNLWAAAVHLVALESYAMELDEEVLADTYDVRVQAMLEMANKIIELETNVFQEVDI